jgi:hypothetical protein
MITSIVMLVGGFVWFFGVGRLEPVVPSLAEAAAGLT